MLDNIEVPPSAAVVVGQYISTITSDVDAVYAATVDFTTINLSPKSMISAMYPNQTIDDMPTFPSAEILNMTILFGNFNVFPSFSLDLSDICNLPSLPTTIMQLIMLAFDVIVKNVVSAISEVKTKLQKIAQVTSEAFKALWKWLKEVKESINSQLRIQYLLYKKRKLEAEANMEDLEETYRRIGNLSDLDKRKLKESEERISLYSALMIWMRSIIEQVLVKLHTLENKIKILIGDIEEMGSVIGPAWETIQSSIAKWVKDLVCGTKIQSAVLK